MKLNPYLTFDGNAREALEFYATALNGQIEGLQTFGEMPDQSMVPDGMEDRLAHGRVTFGDQVVMVSDSMGFRPHTGFSGFSIQTDWDTPDAARAAFDRISDGGAVIMKMDKTFWASAFGLCTDKFGVDWMMNSA